MLALIEGLEAGAKKEELCLVDISGVSETEQEAPAPGYGRMLAIVDGIEARPQKVMTARQQAAKQEERRAVEVAASGQPSKRGNIKKEMQGIVGGMQEMTPKFTELKMKTADIEDLVLPNLPISDQIQELEQIVAALREKSFDREQIKVARQELEGLKRYVEELDAEMAKEKKTLNELDRSLWNMREHRLREALALIKR